MPIGRPMPAREQHEASRTATALELFFDLVAVVAIASATAQFHHAVSAGHGAENFANFLFVFTGIWWAWMNYTWFASGFDNDDAVYRAFTIVIMAGYLGFAAGIEHFFATLDFSYSLIGWVLMRLGMIGLWLRASLHNPAYKRAALRSAFGLLVVQILWVIYALFIDPQLPFYLYIGVFIFLIEFSVPVYASSAGNMPWHRHHIIERYGLLNTIVLGEVLLSISFLLSKLYVSEFDAALLSAAIAGMIVVFVVWWIYFLEHKHLKSEKRLHVFIWGYGHLAIFLSGALLAVGLGVHFDVLTHHSEASLWTANAIINMSVAIYFATLWAIRDSFHMLGLRTIVLPLAALSLCVATYFGIGPVGTAVICLISLGFRIPFSKLEEQAEA